MMEMVLLDVGDMVEVEVAKGYDGCWRYAGCMMYNSCRFGSMMITT